MTYPVPPNEDARLEALRRYRILDTAPERTFDDLVLLAAQVCETPVALVSFVDERRQWFKARVGLAVPETPRDIAFCAHTILSDETMVVEDATKDPRFSDNPLVMGDPSIRFYAGSPLTDSNGNSLGSLCVIDNHSRSLRPEQQTALDALKRIAVHEIEQRQVSAQLADALENLHTLEGLLPICSYCKCVRNDKGSWKQIETYVMEHSDATFSHGICPDCMHEHFPDIASQILKRSE